MLLATSGCISAPPRPLNRAAVRALLKRQKALDAHYCVLNVAGVAGFEPAYAGIKTRCLTAWRHPNTVRLTTCIASPNGSFDHETTAHDPERRVLYGGAPMCQCVPRIHGIDAQGPAHAGNASQGSLEHCHRSGGRFPLRGERGASAGHRGDRLVASTVHGDDLVESADPEDLVDLLR